jgi:hypothetical protein
MRRRILIALLALGTVGGFASGFCSMGYHHHQRQAAWERHVADVCVEAANNRR